MSDTSKEKKKKATTRKRFERRLSHRPEKVWRALTEASELAHWFPASMEGANDHGAPLRFTFPDGKSPTLTGEITEYDPPRTLAYTMGDEKLRWELSPTPRRLPARLHHRGERSRAPLERHRRSARLRPALRRVRTTDATLSSGETRA